MTETNQQPDQNQRHNDEPQTPPQQQGDDQGRQQLDTDEETSQPTNSQPDQQQAQPPDAHPQDEVEFATHNELTDRADNAAQTTVHESGDQVAADDDAARLQMMMDIPLQVTVELGRTTMQLQQAVSLGSGTVIELDRLPGEPLDMYVNDRLVARGEVVVINDALALRITEIVDSRRGAV